MIELYLLNVKEYTETVILLLQQRIHGSNGAKPTST